MKPHAHQLALVLLMFLLVLAVAHFRLRHRSHGEPRFDGEICVGVTHPKTGLGMVCADETTQLLPNAVGSQLLPRDCLGEDLPTDLSIGSHVVFQSTPDGCALERIAPLPSDLRLLAGGKFNVNRDSALNLMTLPGIGEIKAKRIIESRKTVGPFKNVDDLIRVRGIGEKTAHRLEPWLTFD